MLKNHMYIINISHAYGIFHFIYLNMKAHFFDNLSLHTVIFSTETSQFDF